MRDVDLCARPCCVLLLQGFRSHFARVTAGGNADGSSIIKKLTMNPPPFGERMPLGGTPLPDSTVLVIRDWINQGALNN